MKKKVEDDEMETKMPVKPLVALLPPKPSYAKGEEGARRTESVWAGGWKIGVEALKENRERRLWNPSDFFA